MSGLCRYSSQFSKFSISVNVAAAHEVLNLVSSRHSDCGLLTDYGHSPLAGMSRITEGQMTSIHLQGRPC